MRRAGAIAILGLVWSQPAPARDLIRPAELPPADYRGQQYVDSKGCLFLRAGSAGQTVWISRVTRNGVPLCGYPPSGHRVPVEGEGAVAAPPPPPADTAKAPVAAGALLVAVGSYGVAENADRAADKLGAMGLPVHRGSLVRRGKMLITVFAGPFATAAQAEDARRALRGAGFEDALIVNY